MTNVTLRFAADADTTGMKANLELLVIALLCTASLLFAAISPSLV